MKNGNAPRSAKMVGDYGGSTSGQARRSRSGIAAVEFAVVLPLIMVVLLGMWEVGRMLQVQQILETAAREGARQAAGGGRSNSQVRDVILQNLQQAGVPTANAAITIENLTSSTRSEASDAEQMDEIRVSVRVPFNDIRWIALGRITSASTAGGCATWLSLKDKDFPDPDEAPIE